MPRCAKIIKYSQKNDKRLEKCKSEEDDGACDTEKYLAALGTRPPLPAKFENANSMLPVIELFHCCTFEDPKERPSAKDIVAALKPEILANDITISE